MTTESIPSPWQMCKGIHLTANKNFNNQSGMSLIKIPGAEERSREEGRFFNQEFSCTFVKHLYSGCH